MKQSVYVPIRLTAAAGTLVPGVTVVGANETRWPVTSVNRANSRGRTNRDSRVEIHVRGHERPVRKLASDLVTVEATEAQIADMVAWGHGIRHIQQIDLIGEWMCQVGFERYGEEMVALGPTDFVAGNVANLTLDG